MDDLCPSCREPIDWPSGDGCAAMTKHKEKPVNDYNVTRRVAGKVVDRFSAMLRNLEDDFQEEVVVATLMNYYDLCSIVNKDEGGQELDLDEDLLWAIERILQDFMSIADFNAWMLNRDYPKR